MQMKIIVVIILAFSLLGCSTLPSDQSNSSDLLVRKKLIGKWQCYPKDKEDFSVYPPISTINTLIYFKLFNEYFSFRKKFQKALENFLQ